MTNNAHIVINFLKMNVFSRFGIPKNFINDGGSTFATNIFKLYWQSTQ